MAFNPNKPAPGEPIRAEDIRENFRAVVEDRIVDADKLDGYHATSFVLASDFTSANIISKLQNHPTQPLPVNVDQLDGYHASSFVLASDYTSANIISKLQNHPTQPLPINVDQVDGYHASSFVLVSDYTSSTIISKLQNHSTQPLPLNVDQVDGYHVGNSSGRIPVSNGTLNTNLNADMLDGYHASSFVLASDYTSANIVSKLQNHSVQPLPLNVDQVDGYHASSFVLVSDYTSSTIISKLQNHSTQPLPLNVDQVDGYHVGNSSGRIPVSNGTLNTNLNADMVDGYHASSFVLASDYTSANIVSKLQNHSVQPLPLNVDQVDGYHASSFVLASDFTSANIVSKLQNHSVQPLPLNVDLVDGYHASNFATKNDYKFLFRIAHKRQYTRPQRIMFETGSFSSGYRKWASGVFVPYKNQLYCSPQNASSILIINSDLSSTQIGNFSGSDKWIVPTLASNGKIYCPPSDATQILVINPLNNSTELIGNYSGYNKFLASISINKWVVFLPYNASYILKYDISSNTFYSVSVSWRQVTQPLVGPDGWIYFCAYDENTYKIGKYNPDTDQVIWIYSGLQRLVWGACVWGNKLIFGPYDYIYEYSSGSYTIYLCVVNLDTNQIQTKNYTLSINPRGPAPYFLGPDGLIYGYGGRLLFIIDPESEELMYIQVTQNDIGNWATAKLNNLIIGVPYDATTMHVICPYDECQPYP